MTTDTYPTISDTDRIDFVGSPAVSLGIFDLHPKEMMFYLYLPIKLIDSSIIEVPPRLTVFQRLLNATISDYQLTFSQHSHEYDLKERYIYLTAKRLFVTPDNIGNRPGYHCDGFGTDDINYVWSDTHPTVFNRGPFSVRRDDVLALADMEAQALGKFEYSLPEKSLIRIDSLTPHRTPIIRQPGMRTFVKISISKHRYNLEGNSHNYLLSYDWTLHGRSDIRNMENKDFHSTNQ